MSKNSKTESKSGLKIYKLTHMSSVRLFTQEFRKTDITMLHKLAQDFSCPEFRQTLWLYSVLEVEIVFTKHIIVYHTEPNGGRKTSTLMIYRTPQYRSNSNGVFANCQKYFMAGGATNRFNFILSFLTSFCGWICPGLVVNFHF